MFLFNGQYGVASDDNGLYYMRARYYNVSIKRFVNQDVVTGSIAESQSLNRYAYVEGNPVSYLDPFGLEKVTRDKLHDVLAGIGTGANANATIHSKFDVCFDEAVGGVNSADTVLDFIKWIKKIIEKNWQRN